MTSNLPPFTDLNTSTKQQSTSSTNPHLSNPANPSPNFFTNPSPEMSVKLPLLWLLLTFCTYPFHCIAQELLFNGFQLANHNLTLNGIAQIQSNGILRLTNTTPRLLGHVFYPSPIRLKPSPFSPSFSFSTVFAFAIVPRFQKLGGHGMAFAMAPDKELKGALPSQYLGLLNSTDNGNLTNHVFAVEFDTVTDYEFRDINDNHVGIDINSMMSRVSAPAGYFVDGDSTVQNLTLQSGKMIFAWIDYDSDKTQIDVRLSISSQKPNKSILSCEVDLSPFLDEFMYVGFSASTGLLASSHYLMGWSFNVSGDAVPLDPDSLPSLPSPKVGLIVVVSIGSVLGVILALLVAVAAVWWVKNRDVIEPWELNVGPHRFSYKELKVATKGFRDKEVLGFGGFGKVYKGTLPKCGTQVAVKRISRESKQGFQEFVAEIATIGKLRHRNLVQLLGWCRRGGDLLLVYDFMPNGSLDKYLFDRPKKVLTWEQRFNIIKGVASGLLYLHEGWEQTVIHRDLKAGNVLLDAEFNGKLGDFGLAKLYEHGSNPTTTRVVGTMGYLAPELTRTGKPTTSSDLFAFGTFLLEVACGRRPIEPKALPEELVLVDFVCDRWKMGAILDVMDPKLQGEYDEIEAKMVLMLGIMCSDDAPANRPTMRQVVRYLEREVELPELLLLPCQYNSKAGNVAGDSCDSEDYLDSYPSTSYVCCDLEAGFALSLSTSGEGR